MIKSMYMKTMNIIKGIAPMLGLLLMFSLIGCDSSTKTDYQLEIESDKFLEDLFSIYQVTPDEAMEWMYDSTMAVFIDVRSVYDFEKGHIENAINISVANLLDDSYKESYENWKNDSLLVVLYGNDELQANAPWMLLYELGYTNTRVLLGGYGYIDRLYLDELEEGETFTIEDPAYDFAGILKEVEEIKKSPVVIEKAEKKEVVVQKKVKKSAEGGC